MDLVPLCVKDSHYSYLIVLQQSFKFKVKPIFFFTSQRQKLLYPIRIKLFSLVALEPANKRFCKILNIKKIQEKQP